MQELFSKKRLSGYKSLNEHKKNLLLIQKISAKLGIIEIVTRNRAYNYAKNSGKISIIAQMSQRIEDEIDDVFISKQTFGFWVASLQKLKIQDELINIDGIDFKKYSRFNKKESFYKFKKHQKIIVCYSLLLTIRNRAFHFENLLKLRENGLPRITTSLKGRKVSIAPQKIENFINDVLECMDKRLRNYLEVAE